MRRRAPAGPLWARDRRGVCGGWPAQSQGGSAPLGYVSQGRGGSGGAAGRQVGSRVATAPPGGHGVHSAQRPGLCTAEGQKVARSAARADTPPHPLRTEVAAFWGQAPGNSPFLPLPSHIFF